MVSVSLLIFTAPLNILLDKFAGVYPLVVFVSFYRRLCGDIDAVTSNSSLI